MAGKSDNSMFIVGILVLMLLTAGLTYYITKNSTQGSISPSNQTEQTPTITVTGDATRTVTPDMLSVGITVQTSGLTTSDSDALNAAETAKLKAALLATGLNESEIQTQSYYTYPTYNQSCYDCYGYNNGVVIPGAGVASAPMMPVPCSDENCSITGYETTQTILVTSDDVNGGGTYIDAAVNSSNSTSVDYVYFSLKDETSIQIQSELQVEAAANAKSKADDIAKGLGMTLGNIVSVNPTYNPPYPIYAYQNSASGTKSTPPTEIFPTTTTLSSSVTVVYELAQ
jgi:hypothetical protein